MRAWPTHKEQTFFAKMPHSHANLLLEQDLLALHNVEKAGLYSKKVAGVKFQ